MYTRNGVGDFDPSMAVLPSSTPTLDPVTGVGLPVGESTQDLMSFLGMSTPKAPVVGPAPGTFSAFFQQNSTLVVGGAAALLVAVIASGRRR